MLSTRVSIGIAIVLAGIITGQYLLYQSATEKIERLELQLAQSQRTIILNNRTIQTLTTERNQLSTLLTTREQQNQAQRAALQRDLDQTRQELNEIDCANQPWPVPVADRLCADY